MALTRYYNLVGSTQQETEIIGVNDITTETIKSVYLNNIHTSSAATIDLYIYKPSTDTTAEETYYILYNSSLSAKTSLELTSEFGLFNFNNSEYALFIKIGSSDTVDVLIGI
tara:strand:+ start:1462 stop:1797 length:336 start_codon:yes stop_codon:yes gene_type:complete